MKTYKYYQPEYVKDFRCDGQKCNARCCRNRAVDVDKKTYKKYSNIKPKSASKELTDKLKKFELLDAYQINFGEESVCPFLTEDNLCSLQQKYSEDFPPDACINYPRRTYAFGEFYERSLQLTCPVVAETVLLATEPLKFETLDLAEKEHSKFGRYQLKVTLLTPVFFQHLRPMQEAAVKILQERTLSIDGRLMMLELYFDKFEEIVEDNNFIVLEKLNGIYGDTEFLQEQAIEIAAHLKFYAANYLKIMFEILQSPLKTKNPLPSDKKFYDAVLKYLSATDTFDFEQMAQKYISLAEEREQFLDKFSTVFENYLVHEFFSSFCPFQRYSSIMQNYNFFLISYKMLELVAVATFAGKDCAAADLVSLIIEYVDSCERNLNYSKKISEYLQDKDNLVDLMQNLFEV